MWTQSSGITDLVSTRSHRCDKALEPKPYSYSKDSPYWRPQQLTSIHIYWCFNCPVGCINLSGSAGGARLSSVSRFDWIAPLQAHPRRSQFAWAYPGGLEATQGPRSRMASPLRPPPKVHTMAANRLPHCATCSRFILVIIYSPLPCQTISIRPKILATGSTHYPTAGTQQLKLLGQPSFSQPQ